MCISCSPSDKKKIEALALKAGYRSTSAYMVEMSLGGPKVEASSLDSATRWVPWSQFPQDLTGPDTQVALLTKELIQIDGEEKFYTRGGGVYILVKSGGGHRAKLVHHVGPEVYYLLMSDWFRYPLLDKGIQVWHEARDTEAFKADEQVFRDKYGKEWYEMPPFMRLGYRIRKDLAPIQEYWVEGLKRLTRG
jgi:hypothetical protein